MKRAPVFKLIAITLIAIGPGFAWATGLSDYYLKALAADPDYAAARAAYARDVKSGDLAKAAFLPSVSVSASSDRTTYQRTEVVGASQLNASYHPNTIGLRITQPVFSVDRLAYARENEARAAMAEWVLAQARQDLALRLVQTYFNLLLTQDQLALAQAQAQAYEAQLKQLEGLLISRSSTRTDVADARSRYELARAQIRQAQSQLEVRKLEFNKITGETPAAGLPPLETGQNMPLPEPQDPQAWMELARTSSYKVLASQLGVQVAQAGVQRASAGNYPSVVLVANSQQARTSNYFTHAERTDSLSLQLNMSLFDGGSTRAQVAQAVAQEDYARRQLESVQMDASILASQAYWGVVNGVEQVRALEKAEAAASLALEGMRMGIKANVKTYADELNAVQLLYATRRDLQKERYTYWISHVQLAGSAGLQDDDLHRLLQIMVR